MKVHNKMFKIFGALLVAALLFAALPAGEVEANSITSSTIVFESKPGYKLTDNSDGTYSGVIPCEVDGGFDIYAKEGDQAFINGTTVSISADHDAWASYDPDTPDWYQYSLNLYDESGVQKWALRNHPGATAGDPWYDGTLAEPKGVPMSGTMHWGTMYAEETDVGAYLPGTGTPGHDGLAKTNGGGPGYWDMDWSWGSEAVPLEYPGFSVSIEDLGSGVYRVTLTPAEGPVKNITKGTTYATIQAAIDDASDGDRIEVGPGTYVEHLSITKDLTINGAGAGSSIIQSTDTLPLCFTSSADNHAIVCIEDAVVTLDGFTIDGAGKGNSNSRFVGVAFHNAGGTLQNSEVLNIRDTPFSGQHGNAVFSYNEDGTTYTLNILNNEISGFRKNGISLNANDTTPIVGNISGNTVTGAGPTAIIAQNGIQVWGKLATGVVSNNTISGIYYINPDPLENGGIGWTATSILNYLSEDLEISGNTITNGQHGIYSMGTNCDILNNDITVLRQESHFYSEGIFAGNYTETAGVLNIEGNSVTVIDTAAEPVNLPTYGIDVVTGDSNLAVNIDGNTVTDFEVGISLYDIYDGDFTLLNVTTNIVSGSEIGIWPDTLSISPVIEYNQLTDTTDALKNDSGYDLLDASPNWWGSINGPADGQISGGNTTEFSPWCGDAECSFLVYMLEEGMGLQAAIDDLSLGDYLYVPAGTYTDGGSDGYMVGGITIILGDDVVIQNSSPCFTVTGGNTKITTESIGGGKCVATDGDSGIVVNASLTDVIIEGLEITGDGSANQNGIEYKGNITDLQIVNNFIHGLLGSGVSFGGTVTNNQGIQGNMFKDLGAVAISYSGTNLNARYNSWGANAAPTITGVITDPYTFVELEVTPSGALSDSQVAVGDTITYTVMADLTEVTGADFVLKYPSYLLTYDSSTVVTTDFYPLPGKSSVLDTSVAGEIWFGGSANLDSSDDGTSYDPITAVDEVLFTVTFTATSTTGTGKLNLDESTDVFAMFPDPAYSSVNPSNIIYANDLIDGKVTVVELPTITPVDYDGYFAVGVTEEFSLDIDNPTDGGTYANPQLVFDLAGSGATLEYWNGSAWMGVTSPDYEVDLPQLNPGDYTSDFKFRITFPASGSYAISVDLVDTDAESGDADHGILAEAELGADVVDNYSVIGTFSMQGRTVRSGVLVTLTATNYGPFSGTTEDIITDNLTITGVAEDTYTVTTYQPRYLNVTAALGKTITVGGADYTMVDALELRGGNAVWTDNVINVQDASAVGTDYGKTGDMDSDVNFDGKVNIQDLALVGGNFDLTSATAYGSWTP